MPRKFTNAFIDKSIELYNQGLTLAEVSKILNCHPANLSCVLRDRGIDTFANSIKKRVNTIKVVVPDDVIIRYKEGESLLSLSNEYNISRPTLIRHLKRNNITIRNGSQANIIRFANSTIEERKEITKTANEALRGTKYTEEQLSQRANKRQGKFIYGKGELEIFHTLRNTTVFNVELQHAIGKYNVDIICNNFAVEVGVSNSNRVGHTDSIKDVQRIEYINNLNIGVIAVLIAGNAFNASNINKICADIAIICSNPSNIGKNWMIRCGFKDCTSLRNQFGQFPRKKPSERTCYSITEVNGSVF